MHFKRKWSLHEIRTCISLSVSNFCISILIQIFLFHVKIIFFQNALVIIFNSSPGLILCLFYLTSVENVSKMTINVATAEWENEKCSNVMKVLFEVFKIF